MVVSEEGNALGDLRVLDALYVGFHQDGAEAFILVFLEDGERVHADGAASILVAFWFRIVGAGER